MTYKFEPIQIGLCKRTTPKLGLHLHIDTSHSCVESYGLFITLSITIIWNLRIFLTPFGSIKWEN